MPPLPPLSAQHKFQACLPRVYAGSARVPRTLQNFLGHLGQPRVAAGPHTPPLYRCVSSVHICWLAGPVRTSQWAISGPTHSAARGACAQVRSPRASTLPPPLSYSARAREPHSRTHSRSRAPQVELPSHALGGPCALTRPIPLPRALQGRSAHP